MDSFLDFPNLNAVEYLNQHRRSFHQLKESFQRRKGRNRSRHRGSGGISSPDYRLCMYQATQTKSAGV